MIAMAHLYTDCGLIASIGWTLHDSGRPGGALIAGGPTRHYPHAMRLLAPLLASLSLFVLPGCTGSTCEAVGGECVGNIEPCSQGMRPALGGGCGTGVCCLPEIDAGTDADTGSADGGTSDAGN
jgi:hypothetical protein